MLAPGWAPLEQLLLKDPCVLCLCFSQKIRAWSKGVAPQPSSQVGLGKGLVQNELSPQPCSSLSCPSLQHPHPTRTSSFRFGCCCSQRIWLQSLHSFQASTALGPGQALLLSLRAAGSSAVHLYQLSQPHWSLHAEMLALSPAQGAALLCTVLEGSVSWLYPHCSAHEFSGGRTPTPGEDADKLSIPVSSPAPPSSS